MDRSVQFNYISNIRWNDESFSPMILIKSLPTKLLGRAQSLFVPSALKCHSEMDSSDVSPCTVQCFWSNCCVDKKKDIRLRFLIAVLWQFRKDHCRRIFLLVVLSMLKGFYCRPSKSIFGRLRRHPVHFLANISNDSTRNRLKGTKIILTHKVTQL